MQTFAIATGLFSLSLAVAIHDIQGPGHVSPLVGHEVDVAGVVTKVALASFYMQDAVPDDDERTSEGIRVSSNENVAVGDIVRVAGVVREVRPGCDGCSATSDAYANLTTTEIAAASVAWIGHADALPDPIEIGTGPTRRRPPSEIVEDGASGDVESGGFAFDPSRHGLDFYESLEGMRVRIDDARAVGPTVGLAGRGSELAVMPDDGAGFGPFTSQEGMRERPGDDNPERMFLASSAGTKLPILDVGDVLVGHTLGVIDYSFGHFQVIAERTAAGLRLTEPRVPRPLAE